jgi:hypothetical protein
MGYGESEEVIECLPRALPLLADGSRARRREMTQFTARGRSTIGAQQSAKQDRLRPVQMVHFLTKKPESSLPDIPVPRKTGASLIVSI